MTENFDDSLLSGLIGNSDTPADNSGESVMRWFLRNYGTYNGSIVQLRTGKMLPKHLALDEWGAKYSFEEDVPDSERIRMVNPVARIFSFSDRVEILRFGMWPQEPYGFIGEGRFNYFTGWLRKPVEGAIAPWFSFVDNVLVDIPGAADYFHDWVTHMVQKPWLKHHTFLTLAGKQGSGKSLLGKSIAHMLGTGATNRTDQRSPPAYETHGDGFLGHFNKQLQGKVFMVVDELGTDKSKHVATMKHLVTSSTFDLTAKYQDTISQDNYCNFFITTNEHTALLVDEDSRRDVIFNIQQSDKTLMQKLGASLVDWQESGGYEIMLDWYLKRDDNGFNHYASAPRFVGFERNVFQSKNDNTILVDVFCDAVREFAKPIALNSIQIESVLLGLGYQIRGQQFARVLSARPEYLESRLIKSKGKVARCTLCAVPGTLSISVSSQEALKAGEAFTAMYMQGNIETPF